MTIDSFLVIFNNIKDSHLASIVEKAKFLSHGNAWARISSNAYILNIADMKTNEVRDKFSLLLDKDNGEEIFVVNVTSAPMSWWYTKEHQVISDWIKRNVGCWS